jgi:hypothetical protein
MLAITRQKSHKEQARATGIDPGQRKLSVNSTPQSNPHSKPNLGDETEMGVRQNSSEW